MTVTPTLFTKFTPCSRGDKPLSWADTPDVIAVVISSCRSASDQSQPIFIFEPRLNFGQLPKKSIVADKDSIEMAMAVEAMRRSSL
jgi:hypothetical protein